MYDQPRIIGSSFFLYRTTHLSGELAKMLLDFNVEMSDKKACKDLFAFDRYSAGLLPRVARSLCHGLLSSISRSVCLRADIHVSVETKQHNTVSSDDFNLQHFKLRVSNPSAIVYVHFEMPFESSNPPGAGHIFQDWIFENWPPSSQGFIVVRFQCVYVLLYSSAMVATNVSYVSSPPLLSLLLLLF